LKATVSGFAVRDEACLWSRCSPTSRHGLPNSTGWHLSPSCRRAANNLQRRGETFSMTTYLLDTNACIALINGTESSVRRRFQRAVERDSMILLSSVVAFELWYGVAKSQRKDANTERLEAFFAGPLQWTLFDEDDARTGGSVRAELEAAGTPIGAYDVLLAGQARRRGAVLVTSNAKEFARVTGLKWEDWSSSRR
jgi:tRNA(fMet)-specific endonuclease VapC